MHRVLASPVLGILFCLLCSVPALALVSPAGRWQFGELDLNAKPTDPCFELTADTYGGLDFLRQGTLALNNGFYTSDVSPAAATIGSTLAIRFDNARPTDPCRYFQPNDPCFGCDGNFGVELWARSAGAQPDGGFGVVAYGQGSTGAVVFILGQAGNSWFAGIQATPTVGYNLGSVPVTNDWIHLALVVDGGVSKFFANGHLVGFANAAPMEASQGFGAAGFSASHATLPGQRGFYGSLDEGRSFTFEPGQFTPTDLLVTVPEPASLSLAMLGLLGLARRRT